MCEPTTLVIASMALTAASAGYGMYTQRQQAKYNEAYARKAQQEQSDQIHSKRSAEANDRIRKARAERSRLRAISAESGLSGVSIDSVLNNVDFQAGTDVARIGMNEGFDQTNSRYNLQSNLNSIDQPDYVGTTLSTGLQLTRQGMDLRDMQAAAAGNP